MKKILLQETITCLQSPPNPWDYSSALLRLCPPCCLCPREWGCPLLAPSIVGNVGRADQRQCKRTDSALLTSLGQYHGYLFLLKYSTFRISCPHYETREDADEVFMIWVLRL